MTLLAALLLAAATLNGDPPRRPAETGIVSHIRRAPVESTALAAVGYSKRLRALEIEFRNGAVYRYLKVERSIYESLLNAPSKARFYHRNIRGKYASLHVRPRRIGRRAVVRPSDSTSRF